MKIKVATKELRDALNRLSSIPGANGTSIHTQAIHMSADLAGLTLLRYSSEAKVATIIDSEIEILNPDGEPRVGYGPFSALVAACHGKETELTTTEKEMLIVSGRAKSKLRVIDADILTDPPEDELETENVNILLEDLVDVLSFTGSASSNDEAQSYAFCGVGVRMIGKKLHFIGTDKRRVHIINIGLNMPVDCIIPTAGIDAILKAVGGATGGCSFSVGETSVRIVSDTLEISVTLLEGKYPETPQRLLEMPESSIQSKIHINRDEFCEALNTCAAVNEDENRTVVLNIQPKSIEITGGNQKDSETKVTLDCKASAAIKFGIPAKLVSVGLAKMSVAEDGMIELVQYLGVLAARSEDRSVFFAISKV